MPQNRQAIFCKWIFKITYKLDDIIHKYIVILVARGFSQIPRLSYQETYFLVVKINSIRVLIALATQYNFKYTSLMLRLQFKMDSSKKICKCKF